LKPSREAYNDWKVNWGRELQKQEEMRIASAQTNERPKTDKSSKTVAKAQ
jgi:hypothetical protein